MRKAKDLVQKIFNMGGNSKLNQVDFKTTRGAN